MKFDFSTQDLNAMSVDQRKEVLSGAFGKWKMAQAARYVAAFWWIEPQQSRLLVTPPGVRVHNGSVFFVKIEGQLLGVTAAHVYRGFLDAKKHYPSLQCRLGEGDCIFDPEANLCGLGEERDGSTIVDIATFYVTPEILHAINKEPVVVPDGAWPPCHPFSGQESSVVGFPGSSRLWTDPRGISFGIYYGGPAVGAAGDQRITLPFERDSWIDTLGRGLPPEGMNLGGMSGGPLLFLTEADRDWSFNVGGVISEMPQSPLYQTIVAMPAHFIAADGKVLDERSSPIRHYVAGKPRQTDE